jgi:hypothetical protein
MAENTLKNFPRKADIPRDIYRPMPINTKGFPVRDETDNECATRILGDFSSSLEGRDAAILKRHFFEQAYWRDCVAMTYHLRTFKDATGIASELVELNSKRKIRDMIVTLDSPKWVSESQALVNPLLSPLHPMYFVLVAQDTDI